MQRLVQSQITLDEARLIYQYYILKCGKEPARRKAEQQEAANNAREARNRKARRAAKKARRANRR